MFYRAKMCQSATSLNLKLADPERIRRDFTKFIISLNSPAMKRILTAALLLLTTGHTYSQQNWDSIRVVPQKLTENIYMLKGSGGNIGVITGEDGVVMIDDQFIQLSEKIIVELLKFETKCQTFHAASYAQRIFLSTLP
jgi:hypothetical protein